LGTPIHEQSSFRALANQWVLTFGVVPTQCAHSFLGNREHKAPCPQDTPRSIFPQHQHIPKERENDVPHCTSSFLCSWLLHLLWVGGWKTAQFCAQHVHHLQCVSLKRIFIHMWLLKAAAAICCPVQFRSKRQSYLTNPLFATTVCVVCSQRVPSVDIVNKL
jgi:hypothetical protein